MLVMVVGGGWMMLVVGNDVGGGWVGFVPCVGDSAGRQDGL